MRDLQHLAMTMPLHRFLDGGEEIKSDTTAAKARTRKAILCHMAKLADTDSGLCWVANSVLAEAWGLSVRTIQSALRWMETNGMIDILPAYRPSGKQTVNVCILKVLTGIVVDTDRVTGVFENGIKSSLCGPNFTEEGDAWAKASEADTQAGLAWWDRVREYLSKGAYILRSLGYDELLKKADNTRPPLWLKKWMILEPEGDDKLDPLAGSPGFTVYWVCFLYSKQLRGASNQYTSASAMKAQIRRMCSLDVVSGSGQVDREMAARLVLMSILGGWIGLPQAHYLKDKKPPDLIRKNDELPASRVIDHKTEEEIRAKLTPVMPQIKVRANGRPMGVNDARK
jgi:hypothetical protein